MNANGQAYANANATCTWYNTVQSGSFTRNNCGAGGTGGTLTYTVAANTYSSTVSQADANQQAINVVNANGQAHANANASCTWYNTVQSKSFTRNNCVDNGTPGSVTYSVSANTYSSTISQADANQQAMNVVDANGQAHANANATCTWYNPAMSHTYYRQCSPGYEGSSMVYSVAAAAFSSTISYNDAFNQAANHMNTAGQAQVNAQGTCSLPCGGGCVQNDKKCINNVCTTGTPVQIDCQFDPETNKYKYWYAYYFPDGTWSTYTYYVIRPDACGIE